VHALDEQLVGARDRRPLPLDLEQLDSSLFPVPFPGLA